MNFPTFHIRRIHVLQTPTARHDLGSFTLGSLPLSSILLLGMVDRMRHRIFAYGTLKKGGLLHDLVKNFPYLGVGKAYDMELRMFRNGTPFITPKKGGWVYGELYEINDETLNAIDQLEANSGYGKITLTVNGAPATMWAIHPVPHGTIAIPEGDYNPATKIRAFTREKI